MNTKSLLSYSLVAAISVVITYLVAPHSPTPARSPDPAATRLEKTQTSRVRTAFKSVTWAELSAPQDMNQFVQNLLGFGMDPASIRAVAAARLERDNAALPLNQRRLAELALEDSLQRLGIKPPTEGETRLAFLSPDRSSQVNAKLSGFDAPLRELQAKYTKGELEGSDYFDRWTEIRRQREATLLTELTPEERRQWIVKESATAEALRDLPHALTPQQFEQVAMAKYEANRQLERPDVNDVERQRIETELKSQLQAALGEDGYKRFARAEDPRYGAYANLATTLGVTREASDYVFDWQKYVYSYDASLREQGFSDDEVIRLMKVEADKAATALRQAMKPDQFEAFLKTPQSIFLSAYDPLTANQ